MITIRSPCDLLCGYQVVTTTTVTTTVPPSTSPSISTSTSTRSPVLVLFLLVPPPTTVRVREPFDVLLRLTTESGLPVPGGKVEALAIAPKSSRAKLSGGPAFTDGNGTASMRLSFEAGVDGQCGLLFVSGDVIRSVHAATPEAREQALGWATLSQYSR